MALSDDLDVLSKALSCEEQAPWEALARLRARVAELEAVNRTLREQRDKQHREMMSRYPAEQRAATLQAEVERLTSTLDSVSDEYARKRIEWSRALAGGADAITSLEQRAVRAEQALAESERKRAELSKALADMDELADLRAKQLSPKQ